MWHGVVTVRAGTRADGVLWIGERDSSNSSEMRGDFDRRRVPLGVVAESAPRAAGQARPGTTRCAAVSPADNTRGEEADHAATTSLRQPARAQVATCSTEIAFKRATPDRDPAR
jgi:hypothetical protein